jgi:UDP-N-acetylmuramate dehydrogenase
MMEETLLNRLPERVAVVRGAKLRDYTTFKLGGACPALIACPDAESLAETVALLHAESVGFLVIGQGSNLLVADAGINSVVLRYCAEGAPDVEFDGFRVRVSGNTLLDDLARLAIERGVGDLSYCSGIPGSVGGAIAGNAGAFGRQIGDVVESVQLLDADGRRREVPGSELGFEYRLSSLKQTGGVVLGAVLKLKPENVQTMEKERERIMELRRTKHPDWRTMPCAGSVFRNVEPTSAAERRQAAGWFLEEAGVKNFRVGGACLFEKHANIIITEPAATARDVFELTEKMIAAVREKFGFQLEREIKLLGEFGSGLVPVP